MSRATSQVRNFANRLISYESSRNQSSKTITPAAFPILEKLRPNLVTLMGKGGFQVLLSRALALAHSEVPWLRTVHVNADGVLEGLDDEALARIDPTEFLKGRVAMLAQLLGLLVAFIGEDVTLRMVRDIWPRVSLNDLDLSSGDRK